MYNDVSTRSFPKTLLIRNTEDGIIWQVYNVLTEGEAQFLAGNATRNGFESVTLVDFDEESEETFPDWRDNTDYDEKNDVITGPIDQSDPPELCYE